MDISKTIFFFQTQNGHGNFQGHFFFLQTQNGHENFQSQCLQTLCLQRRGRRGGGGGRGRIENDHGHFQHFCVFSAELEILKIQRILSIRYFFCLARPGV